MNRLKWILPGMDVMSRKNLIHAKNIEVFMLVHLLKKSDRMILKKFE